MICFSERTFYRKQSVGAPDRSFYLIFFIIIFHYLLISWWFLCCFPDYLSAKMTFQNPCLLWVSVWGCVRATRSLHEEVPGIWFTSCFYSSYSSNSSTLSLTYFYQLLLNYSSTSRSSIVAVLIAKAGLVWVSWPEEFLLCMLSLTLQQVCYW